jgi:hypothetical protein
MFVPILGGSRRATQARLAIVFVSSPPRLGMCSFRKTKEDQPAVEAARIARRRSTLKMMIFFSLFGMVPGTPLLGVRPHSAAQPYVRGCEVSRMVSNEKRGARLVN